MKTRSLRLALFPMLVGTTVGALGCSSTNSNNVNRATAQVPARNSTVVARDRLPQSGQVAAQQAGMLPPYAGQATQPTTVANPADGQTLSADSQSPLPANAPPDAIVQTVSSESGVQEINRKAIGDEVSFHDRHAPRRSFVDITAQPWFQHAPDYSWLAGQLRYCKPENCWKLRYASLDENDRYNGEVTLIDYPALEYLKDGQYVRVNGQLVDPSKREAGSVYKVASMQPVQKTGDILVGSESSDATRPTSITH
jgi:hypothetical protein